MGNYQCKLNIKCQFCPQHQGVSSNSLVTLVAVCHDLRSEVKRKRKRKRNDFRMFDFQQPILLSSIREQNRNVDDQMINRTSSQSQVSDLSLASTTAQSDGDLTSTSQHRQKDAILLRKRK